MATAKKVLYKSDDDRKLDGVCAGIGEYFDVDATLVRVGFVFVTLISGIMPGIIAYIVLAVVIPRKSEVKK
jgi:phage shock protein C